MQQSLLRGIDAAAEAIMRQNRGQLTPNLYADVGQSKMTKERAYAQFLEDSPEVYEQYRAQHNARPIVATLEAAGLRVSSR
jgi:hypothetical protein